MACQSVLYKQTDSFKHQLSVTMINLLNFCNLNPEREANVVSACQNALAVSLSKLAMEEKKAASEVTRKRSFWRSCN